MEQVKSRDQELVSCPTPAVKGQPHTYRTLSSPNETDADPNHNLDCLSFSKFLDSTMRFIMTNTPVVPGAMTQAESMERNQIAIWPQIKDSTWTTWASSLPPRTSTQSELDQDSGTIPVSSCPVRSAASSCQTMVHRNNAEEPSEGVLELDTARSWGFQDQGPDAICNNNRNIPAKVRVNASRISPGITSRLHLGIAQEKQSRGPSKIQSHEPGRKTSGGAKRISPADSEAVKQRPDCDSGDKGLYKRRKTKDITKDDECDAPYNEDLHTGPYVDTNSFACPFYRRYPIRHKDCMNRKLTRIRDVKQHIMRRHIQTTFYCPTCYESYPSSRLSDKHIQSRCCEPRPPPILDTLDSNSKEVQDLVSYRASSSLTQEEKWHEIWRLLFREESSGKNAFLGTLTEETIDLIRDFWEQRSFQILPTYLATRGVTDDLGADINSLFMDLLGEVQVGLKEWTPQQADQVVDSWKLDPTSHTGRSLSMESAIYEPPGVDPTPERIGPGFLTPMAPMSSASAPMTSPDELPSIVAEAFMFGDSTGFSPSMQETDWSWFKLDDHPKVP